MSSSSYVTPLLSPMTSAKGVIMMVAGDDDDDEDDDSTVRTNHC